MLLCIVYAMLFVDSADIYRENYLNVWGCLLLLLHAACINSVDITWILQKLLFSHTSFWRESFLNISNHLPDSEPEVHLHNWPI